MYELIAYLHNGKNSVSVVSDSHYVLYILANHLKEMGVMNVQLQEKIYRSPVRP